MGRPRAVAVFPLFRSEAAARILAAVYQASDGLHVRGKTMLGERMIRRAKLEDVAPDAESAAAALEEAARRLESAAAMPTAIQTAPSVFFGPAEVEDAVEIAAQLVDIGGRDA